MDDEPEPGANSIVLNEGDRQLVWMAARLLMAQDPGQKREDATEHLMQGYREDLTDAYPGVDTETLDEMADNFCDALLLEAELLDGRHEDESGREVKPDAYRSPRRRVLAALGIMLADLNPRQ